MALAFGYAAGGACAEKDVDGGKKTWSFIQIKV
jgi:hypothetical protein